MRPTKLLLKLTLDELGIAKDWKKLNYHLVFNVLEDMAKHDVYDFGYRRHPDLERELYGPWLHQDLSDINRQLDSLPKDLELVTSFKKQIREYKDSESFKKIISGTVNG